MARGPGRPASSAEDKERRKEAALAKKAMDWASTAMERFPKTKELREPIFQTKVNLEATLRDARNDLSEHVKRMRSVYGIMPKAEKIRDLLLSSRPGGEREALINQVRDMLDDASFEVQFDLFGKLKPGTPANVDEKPVFDTTSTGKATSARKAKAAALPEPAKEAAPVEVKPGLPLAEAEKLFEAAKAAKPPRKAAAAKADKPAAAPKKSGPPPGPEMPGDSFAANLKRVSDDGDKAIRERSATLAAGGPPPGPKGLGPNAIH